MQTCPGFFLKSLLESPGNLLEICSVKFVDTLLVDAREYLLTSVASTLSRRIFIYICDYYYY